MTREYVFSYLRLRILEFSNPKETSFGEFKSALDKARKGEFKYPKSEIGENLSPR